MSADKGDASVIRLKPMQYIHVLDNNKSVTRVEVGPQTFTRQEHEKIVFGPEEAVKIPPRHYCVIGNPICRSESGVEVDVHGNVKVRHGDEEIRFSQEPFILFPGEKLIGKVSPLTVVAPDSALRLRAVRDFVEGKTKRFAGDEWLFKGPATYIPRVEVSVCEVIKAIIIKPNQALKIRARKATLDFQGRQRMAGEEWLVRDSGAYLPGVDEEIIETLTAHILTEKKALHLRALKTFIDIFGKERKAGEEWLVTPKDCDAHLVDVYEQFVGAIKLTTLTNRQYCVILDPIGPSGKPQLGQKVLKRGEESFFLRPGERLENGIQEVFVLNDQEALLLRAKEPFETKQPGDRWMIHGPVEFVPPVQVEIIEKRTVTPLDDNEGIYVRDTKSGKVRAEIGHSYMLLPNEELWKKELPQVVEEILAKERTTGEERDKTRVVTFRTPHNSAVQIFDYTEKKSRVVFGPDLVLLNPDEQFTVLSLSGEKPKRPHMIKTIALQLGPDFMTDIVTVETSDHARLSLKLSYNWFFEFDKVGAESLFKVPDFVGDACKAIASRVRGAVASTPFDLFHKSSAKIIRTAVFGIDEKGKIRNHFKFPSNGLVITNIDIQSVEPVDAKTRDSLQKSVQLAIEITTKSQEAEARHEAERMEQDAKGRLERQKIDDEAEAEKSRRLLLQLQAECSIVESSGAATAEAKARAESLQIEGESSVKQAKLKADSMKIKLGAELDQKRSKQSLEVDHQKALIELEVEKAKQLSDIEAEKFQAIISAIGPQTIKAISQAGPELQARLLKGLGLKSFMITDGNTPINLFNMAKGLVSTPDAPTAKKPVITDAPSDDFF